MRTNLFAARAGLAAMTAMLAAGCSVLSTDWPDEAPTAPTAAVSPAAEKPAEPWRLEGQAMAAAADPRAVEAATDVLSRGGTAVDAAIAAHTVLGLVEPQSSGLGGGLFMAVYDRSSGATTIYDGRETAPSGIDETLFLKDDGSTMGFLEAWQSGRSVGVPGAVAAYAAAHADHGKLEWAELFMPARSLARDGFIVSPRLAELLASPRLRGAMKLDDTPQSAAYFYPEGEPLKSGERRTNPQYADLVERIAAQGTAAFYEGAFPVAIEHAVASAEIPGALTAQDISAYTPVKRQADCGTFKTYTICSAPPPSSGSVGQNMITGLYERFSGDQPLEGDAALKAFVDAQRLAYADRDHYVADQDFVDVPFEDLIDPRYLDARAGDRFAPDTPSFPGDPGAVLRDEPIIDMWGRDATEHAPGTTHLSIVDAYGNAVAMTATVEAAFGSSIWVPEGGFVLNNELTDFARTPTLNGKPLANAPAANKRPRSSMSPTIVFDESGDLFMVTGSPGGNSIVAYTAKTLLGVLEWDRKAQEAIDLPNVIARGDTVNVEVDVEGGPAAADALRGLGYEVRERRGENSGLHVIVARDDHLEGGADPRREGVAVGVTLDEN